MEMGNMQSGDVVSWTCRDGVRRAVAVSAGGRSYSVVALLGAQAGTATVAFDGQIPAGRRVREAERADAVLLMAVLKQIGCPFVVKGNRIRLTRRESGSSSCPYYEYEDANGNGWCSKGVEDRVCIGCMD